MFNELLKSKNAPAALILLLVGALLAMVLPGLQTAFPGWAAGFIGLVMGSIAGVLLIYGRGASRSDLLVVRGSLKAALRGEQGARPVNMSPELAELFGVVDQLAAEIERRGEHSKELTSTGEKLKLELDKRADRVVQVDEELRLHMQALAAGLSDQSASIEQVASSMRQTAQVLGSVAESVEVLASSADESSSSIVEMRNNSDEVAANMSTLAESVRDTVSSIEEMAHSIKEVARNVDAL